jgi:hypothetical protein
MISSSLREMSTGMFLPEKDSILESSEKALNFKLFIAKGIFAKFQLSSFYPYG